MEGPHLYTTCGILNKCYIMLIVLFRYTQQWHLQSKQVKRSSHEWINKFTMSRMLPPVLSLAQLHWLPVNQRINYKILLLTYKALNGQAPSYITELLEPYTPARNLRSFSKNLLKIPLVKLVSYGHRCFSFAALTLWNSLSDFIRQSSSLSSFKTYIKTYIFKKCISLI